MVEVLGVAVVDLVVDVVGVVVVVVVSGPGVYIFTFPPAEKETLETFIYLSIFFILLHVTFSKVFPKFIQVNKKKVALEIRSSKKKTKNSKK